MAPDSAYLPTNVQAIHLQLYALLSVTITTGPRTPYC